MLMACQDQGWPRHGKPLACHRARQCIGQGMTHCMPKQGVAKIWQADCFSPGKAMCCSWHAKTRGAKAWQANCLSPGKAMHCSRHVKTKGGQGMTHGMPKQGEAKAWQANYLSPGKAMHCSWHAKTKGGQGMNHGMPKQVVSKSWQADFLSPGKECIAQGIPRPRVAKA
ncbi:hypothetical protein RHGRI_010952 [Rhododendron griersonianum]|uniref:Uncharacterized protein n=1 Tax=Rhododendron griersonianum TaxID=479676 RepID=A0AAV6KK77_9ERIC|nr:hypothetical protein RHGRI_010952 [Rhododendron griersonianum]